MRTHQNNFASTQQPETAQHFPVSPVLSRDRTREARIIEEGACTSPGNRNAIKPAPLTGKKIAINIAPVLRKVPGERINALDEIARLAGKKPPVWNKPKFGDFEYWLAHNCGWIVTGRFKEGQLWALQTGPFLFETE